MGYIVTRATKGGDKRFELWETGFRGALSEKIFASDDEQEVEDHLKTLLAKKAEEKRINDEYDSQVEELNKKLGLGDYENKDEGSDS